MSCNRNSLGFLLLGGGSTLIAAPALAQAAETGAAPETAQAAPAPAQAASAPAPAQAGEGDYLQDIIVTGSTSGKRTLLTSSSDVTLATSADIQRKAPRSTADVLELVPGIFVEGTAGPVSNNYSVRGLRGGAQTFITLEEDGMPIIYGGGGADEYFQNDITIDRVEAVEGGTSGILAVNGAAATINFISRTPDFNETYALVRFTGTTYRDFRADAYFTAPITDSLAFNLGGYVDSTPGVRSSPFIYNTYHLKGMLEQKLGDDGYVRLTAKVGNEHDPYYADMPYHVENGHIEGIPGLSRLSGNIAGDAFGNIAVPDACATGHCLWNFSLASGIHTKTQQLRVDAEKSVSDNLKLFAHARYLNAKFDFNGIFAGSGAGTGGLASAVDYLDPAASPLAALHPTGDPALGYFDVAAAAFPGTAQYALRNVRTGEIIPASDTAALNALNGNGLIQQTVLNHQYVHTRDFGSNFGATWDASGSWFDNSLTVGAMYYDVRKFNNQSGVTAVINDVRNNSNIYDVVALDAGNDVIGQLTNNGMISYGNWGTGIFRDHISSISGYFNDELKIGSNLRIDFGARYEHQHDTVDIGNQATVNDPVPAGTPGLFQDVGPTFDGTYRRVSHSYHHWATTVGANYTITPNLAVYGRFATGFQTNGGDTGGTHPPTKLLLYEGGVRYQNSILTAVATVFRTEFDNQYYQFNDPNDPTIQNSFQADMSTTGVEGDITLRPVHFFSIDAEGVYQRPKLSNVRINGAAQSAYDGNTPERTPKVLFTVTPAFILPNGLGELYFRYKYIGKIYADSGNGVALPHYAVMSVGGNINLTDKINLNVSVDNITNVHGYTEGNPRQGQTQSIVNGYFYGRGIVGRNALVSLTFKL